MSTVSRLVTRIRATATCAAAPPAGAPTLRLSDVLPPDLAEFYALCGGASLFVDSTWPMRVVSAQELVRANPVVVGVDSPDDISDHWYIVARGGLELVTIDCSPERLGRCHDSFWDRHGVAGSCAVVALSFTELLERLLDSRGEDLGWLVAGTAGHGDAYDQAGR